MSNTDLCKIEQQHELINLFLQLCRIPSPPLGEAAVAEMIMQIFKTAGIEAEYDSYGNIIARLPGTEGYADKQPLLLSAHMDVIGGSEPVNPRLSADVKYIETDKTRTLGADDKAGVAAILDLALNLAHPDSKIPHMPLEIIFTRDEERGMTGIQNLDSSKLKAKYAIIADADKLGELDCEGAGFTNIYIRVHGGKGGHSGINIHETDRVSAIKVLSELDSMIPQGVYRYNDQKGVITSINAGVAIGGTADTWISEAIKDAYDAGSQGKPLPDEYQRKNIMDMVTTYSALNVITSEAAIAYSLRSSQPDNEAELITLIKNAVDALNAKYSGLIRIEFDVKHHLLPFVRNEDTYLSDVIVKAAERCGIYCTPSSFHAGAETHVLANEKKNYYGELFNPVIIGVADLENIHSADEKIDWQSFLRGRKWLEEIVASL